MLKHEFLEMQRQDIETSNNELYKQLLIAMEEVLKEYPSSINIDSSLTIEACYNKMKEEAHEKAVSGCYCFGPIETREFIIRFLGLTEIHNTNFVNLEDFM